MAGEGFIAHMIASLNNNKRSKSSSLGVLKEKKSSRKTKLFFKNKASDSDLMKLRAKLKKERRNQIFKEIAIVFIVIFILLYAIGFVKF